MSRIFGFDIGTTSIGFAVIDHDPDRQTGRILRLGVRIFPEARDPDGTPLNQQRRQKRMARRQLRRRRQRRRTLNEALSARGLLPRFGTPQWDAVMAADPYELRRRGLTEELSPHELGRALYHLSKRRHFRGRDFADSGDETPEDDDEKTAQASRESTVSALRQSGKTLGAWLAARGPHERKRGVHATRAVVEEEFARLWSAQAPHHPALRDEGFRGEIEQAIFAQRPVFWRKNTLGTCPFTPGMPLCPKGSWISQQRRMLEKLNNLAIGGNARKLDDEERAAILARLQTKPSLSWAGVRSALRPLYKARGEAGLEKTITFNLELGGETRLPGNAVEAKLAEIFGEEWDRHPHKQAIREAVPQKLWAADYGEIGDQRVVILPARERERRREEAARGFIQAFGITSAQAASLQKLTFPTGWEPYSTEALRAFLPHLEAGVRFGALVNGPEWEEWRNRTFPDRERPTGEVFDRLPSPADREESRRIAKLRNPTVVRTQNELRKVTNNLIAMFGKPDLIRIEVAREVGASKREREEMQDAIRRNERRRKEAISDLKSKGIPEPSRDDVEKWLLWKESRERCPYTGDQIGFDALFREGLYQVEHIWPRSRSFDDSFRNKTLCRKDINIEKGDRTPFEYLGHDEDRWTAIRNRLSEMAAGKGKAGMSPGKIRRFLAERLPEDFAARQLNDTGYAARQAIAFLNRLWPDLGPEAPVRVQAVGGRVTAQLRRLWSLNNILADDGEKTRADHRHHAIDALTVACTHPGMINRLSRYWQLRDDPRAERPQLPPPWPTIRADAEKAVAKIVVSHRVRKKISGPLHRETIYGDTGIDVRTKNGVYRCFVTREKVEALTRNELNADPLTDGEGIRDTNIRAILKTWVDDRGGDPTKAFPPYPTLGAGGPAIRKVRLLTKQQLSLMARIGTGYADLGKNHHIAIFRGPDGKAVFEAVSLLEAARRRLRGEPVVRRVRQDGAIFVMSLSPGDALQFAKDSASEVRIWIVQNIASKGQISLLEHTDASSSKQSLFAPKIAGLLSRQARKIAVDPIGRIRPAND